ncbi:MAG TPA: DNA-formamidopyrimidine glycosylase family protein [Candidatus Limnocylindrales bacterium]|nr:DNA-formamidopyrimidine glycosylase family protein [Candidatus Limnocylindrales bacterium]
MPELPDLAIVVDAFHAALAGRSVVSAAAPGPLAVRGTPAELEALVGQALRSVRRRGKFVELSLDRDAVVVNAMLTGRFQLASPGTKLPTKTAVVIAFGGRSRPPRDAAAWTRGAPWMPADGASVEIRYRDPTQMGKVYLVPAGVDRPVPGYDETLGPDADDPALTLEAWRERIRRHPGELKPLLRNQLFVAGIGNAYSDEILHAARLNPFRKRSTLAGEEVDELFRATKGTLGDAIGVLRARVPPSFETEVRDFLAVHRKGGQPCPRCGTRLSEVSSRSEATTWCRGCQR